MKHKILRIKYIYALLLPLIFAACKRNDPLNVGKVNCYIPIYSDRASAEQVSYGPPIAFEKGGKIVIYNNKIYQVEEDKGIHILANNGYLSAPTKIGFINIPLCREVTIRNGFIYTNNIDDLITINLNDVNNPLVANTPITPTNRLRNKFPSLVINQIPQNVEAGSYFVCPDASKLVIRWELTQVDNPKCKTL